MTELNIHFSHGARFANFSDLDTASWRSIYDKLDQHSERYLQQLSAQNLWPKEYYWPQNSLRTNTRVWEYPYVADAANRHCPKGGKILDIGSALTFFPHFLADQGYDVYAMDYDPQMVTWGNSIITSVDYKPDNTAFNKRLSAFVKEDATDLSFPEASFDFVSNVSVLEHMSFPLIEKSIASVHRVLRPGGVFACTLDCHFAGTRTAGHAPLTDEEFKRFIEILTRHFDLLSPIQPTAPHALITNRKVPDFLKKPAPKRSLRSRIRMARSVFSHGSEKLAIPQEWVAFGILLRKKGA